MPWPVSYSSIARSLLLPAATSLTAAGTTHNRSLLAMRLWTTGSNARLRTSLALFGAMIGSTFAPTSIMTRCAQEGSSSMTAFVAREYVHAVSPVWPRVLH
eukprot:4826915-Prymnesium_polylepis.2